MFLKHKYYYTFSVMVNILLFCSRVLECVQYLLDVSLILDLPNP